MHNENSGCNLYEDSQPWHQSLDKKHTSVGSGEEKYASAIRFSHSTPAITKCFIIRDLKNLSH